MYSTHECVLSGPRTKRYNKKPDTYEMELPRLSIPIDVHTHAKWDQISVPRRYHTYGVPIRIKSISKCTDFLPYNPQSLKAQSKDQQK